MNNEQTKKRFSVRDASWVTIGLAVLSIVTFLAVSDSRMGYGGGYRAYMGNSGGVEYSVEAPTAGIEMDKSSAPSQSGAAPDYYPYPGGGEVPVTDTREFLKTYYNAQMQTRDVMGLTRRVETTVRGYDGRVDQQSSSDKYGSVSFALPESKYEAFRAELESMVGSRFLSVNISSQNLLSQKVSIEDQQKQANTRLADYQTSRANLISPHASTVQLLQSKINNATAQLAPLRAQVSTPPIESQIQTLTAELSSLNKQLASENTRYSSALKSADANIASAQQWQKAVQTQDKKLLDSVATVTGTVSIRWISFWDMLQLYLPGNCIPGIFLLLTIISFWNDRRRALVVRA
jgi:hypothetical protein